VGKTTRFIRHCFLFPWCVITFCHFIPHYYLELGSLKVIYIDIKDRFLFSKKRKNNYERTVMDEENEETQKNN
jgi:hypothetical protein